MATRAQTFRAQSARSAALSHAKKRKPTDPRGLGRGTGSSKHDNFAERVSEKAGVAFEQSATKPSRKSTRRGENHLRAASALERSEHSKLRAPKVRAEKAKAKATTVRGKARS